MLSYGNSVTLQICHFKTLLNCKIYQQQKYLDNSILFGIKKLAFTVKFKKYYAQKANFGILLLHPEDQRNEKGRISILFRYKSHDLKAQVEDNVERIKEIYQDSFEKMKKQLEKIKSLNMYIEPTEIKNNFSIKDQIETQNNQQQKIINIKKMMLKNQVKESSCKKL
ncbi:unnamed protein product [Paramecium primaurelia]|uniref:Uncharacterized protein n=1 Tax=Paramecium primaurelia TaxID=5886 RepID=A0A8S1JME5_PARPR|nr:unnamed protein product [Paramecium primaurelia]